MAVLLKTTELLFGNYVNVIVSGPELFDGKL